MKAFGKPSGITNLCVELSQLCQQSFELQNCMHFVLVTQHSGS